MSVPVATTQTESLVRTSTARINGKILDDGGESCQARFRWRKKLPTIFYPLLDGELHLMSPNYNSVHNAASASTYDSTSNTVSGDNTYYSEPSYLYLVARGVFQFDTSIIPDSRTIASAELWLWAKIKDEDNSGQATTHIVDGSVVEDSPVVADYGDLLGKVASGGSVTYGDVVDGDYTKISLNATGLSWISKGGRTKLSVRAAGDVDGNQPTGKNYIEWYSTEKGEDYRPQLVIVYEDDGWVETDWQDGLGTNDTFYEDLTGLTPNAEYEFQAQAKNESGEGEWSTSATFRTAIYTSPLPAHRNI